MEDMQSLIQKQIKYCPVRAPEYNEWFPRQVRYDRREALNKQCFQEVGQVRNVLDRLRPSGKILELPCGTGLWTEQLLAYNRVITGVDAAPEVLAIHQQWLSYAKIKYIQAVIFSWQPEEKYDFVFYSFWLSHVPAQAFESFWKMTADALRPGGRVLFVDSKREPTSTARDHRLEEVQSVIVNRRLNNGREFQNLIIFYERESLEGT